MKLKEAVDRFIAFLDDTPAGHEFGPLASEFCAHVREIMAVDDETRPPVWFDEQFLASDDDGVDDDVMALCYVPPICGFRQRFLAHMFTSPGLTQFCHDDLLAVMRAWRRKLSGKSPAIDTTGWLKVSQAAQKVEVDNYTISRACDDGDIVHNGKKNRDRRVEPRSLQEWAKEKRARDRSRDDHQLNRPRATLRNNGH